MDPMQIVASLLSWIFPLLFLYVIYRFFLRLGSSTVRSARKAHNRAFKS
jgi:uncharacterized membrane protein YfcA